MKYISFKYFYCLVCTNALILYFYLSFFNRFDTPFLEFLVIVNLSYAYKLMLKRKCPNCGKMMEKIVKKSIFYPDFDKCFKCGHEEELSDPNYD